MQLPQSSSDTLVLVQQRHTIPEVFHPFQVGECHLPDLGVQRLGAAVSDDALPPLIQSGCTVKAQKLVMVALAELPFTVGAAPLTDEANAGLGLFQL